MFVSQFQLNDRFIKQFNQSRNRKMTKPISKWKLRELRC